MVRQVSHEVAVMYLGRIVEQGDPDRLFAAPAHPYTRALVSAIPVAHRAAGSGRIVLTGEPPNPVDRAGGLRLPPALPDRRRALPHRDARRCARWPTAGAPPAISPTELPKSLAA